MTLTDSENERLRDLRLATETAHKIQLGHPTWSSDVGMTGGDSIESPRYHWILLNNTGLESGKVMFYSNL